MGDAILDGLLSEPSVSRKDSIIIYSSLQENDYFQQKYFEGDSGPYRPYLGPGSLKRGRYAATKYTCYLSL